MRSLADRARRLLQPALPTGVPAAVPTAVVAACAALVLGSGVVTALVLPTSTDRTSVLRHPVKVTVTPTGGVPAPAHDGQVLDPGDVVTVAQNGSGQIVTGARRLLLGAPGTSTQVRVDGPASTELRRGSVVAIDSGKPWSLQADQVAVGGINGAVRIDYGFNIRVADYTGRADLTVPTGAATRLTGLDQVALAGSVLQGAAVPLRLDDDALDTAADAPLVTLDRALTSLAAQIDADPNLLADYRSTGQNPSETVLPAAIGAAGTGGTPNTRARTALAARRAQASWGVVATSAGAQLAGVRDELSRLLDSPAAQAVAQIATPAPGPATSAIAIPATSTPASVASPVLTPAPASSPVVAPTRAGSGGPQGQPSRSSSPTAPTATRASAQPQTPTPSPASSALLNSVLNTVGGLLPSALPIRLGSTAPPPSPTPGAAVSPAPLVDTLVTTVGGLLGGSGH